MSDDNGKLLDDLGDLDWDSALDEWDKNMFVPEVARDAETNKARGVLEWRFPLAAKANQDLRFGFEVRHPKGREMGGLGE